MSQQNGYLSKRVNGYSLRIKLITGVVLIFLVFASVCIFWFSEFYKKDKIAYLFDLQLINSIRLSETVKAMLNEQSQLGPKSQKQRQLLDKSNSKILTSLQSTGLKRLPLEGEFFVYLDREKRQWQMLYQHSAKGIVAQIFTVNSLFKNASFDTSSRQWIVTDQATVVWHSQMRNQAGSSGESQMVLPNYLKKSLNIKMSQSASTFANEQGESIIVVVKAVDGTNLLAISEIPLNVVKENLQRPLQEFLLIACILLALLIITVTLVARSVTSSMSVVESLLSAFARGEMVQQMPVVSAEFAKVGQAFWFMQNAVLQREAKLNQFVSAIQSALSLAVSHGLFDSFSKSAAAIFRVLQHAVPGLSKHDVFWAMEIAQNGKSEWYRSSPEGIGAGAQRLHNPQELIEQLRQYPDLKVILLGPESHLMAILAINTRSELNQQEASLLNVVVSTLKSIAERLVLARLEKDSVKSTAELDVARELQMSCLMEKVSGTGAICVEHSLYYEPCSKMGGDWYGIMNHSDRGHVNFFVGDVTGHGVGSAFVTSLVSGIVQNEEQSLLEGLNVVEQGKHLELLAKRLNLLIYETAAAQRWMTMLLGCIDYKNGYFYCVNAGHVSPFLLTDSGEVKVLATAKGNPLGSQSNEEFASQRFEISSGDTILFPTDGLLESFLKADGSKLSTKDLKKVVSAVTSRPEFKAGKLTKHLANEVVQQVLQMATPAPVDNADDVTLMSVTWLRA